jgi:hypothetical protein
MPPAAGLMPKPIWCAVVVALMLCVLRSAEAAQGERHEISRSNRISIFLPSPIPLLRVSNGNPLVTTSLAFSVSVCLADVEYSIACWERGLAEAAKRLEQIYLDDYVTRRAAGSLKVWFPLATEQSEQLRFLREVEERAIKTVAAKLQAEGDQSIASQMDSPEEYGGQQGLIRRHTQQAQKWREDASMEARRGTNWSHDWTSKTHSYQVGPALQELAHISNQNRSRN